MKCTVIWINDPDSRHEEDGYYMLNCGCRPAVHNENGAAITVNGRHHLVLWGKKVKEVADASTQITPVESILYRVDEPPPWCKYRKP